MPASVLTQTGHAAIHQRLTPAGHRAVRDLLRVMRTQPLRSRFHSWKRRAVSMMKSER